MLKIYTESKHFKTYTHTLLEGEDAEMISHGRPSSKTSGLSKANQPKLNSSLLQGLSFKKPVLVSFKSFIYL